MFTVSHLIRPLVLDSLIKLGISNTIGESKQILSVWTRKTLVICGIIISLINKRPKDNKKGFAETTTVNAGAALKFGEMIVDGSIGGTTGSTGNGQLNTDTLMSRVSMTYNF